MPNHKHTRSIACQVHGRPEKAGGSVLSSLNFISLTFSLSLVRGFLFADLCGYDKVCWMNLFRYLSDKVHIAGDWISLRGFAVSCSPWWSWIFGMTVKLSPDSPCLCERCIMSRKSAVVPCAPCAGWAGPHLDPFPINALCLRKTAVVRLCRLNAPHGEHGFPVGFWPLPLVQYFCKSVSSDCND